MHTPVRKRPVRVLLVDVRADDAVRACELLTAVGHVPQWVSSFAAAREAAALQTCDVILAAQALDERTGLELLHALGGHACRAPFILLTARPDSELDVRASEEGAADCLVKGELTPALLERSIRYGIARRAAQDATRLRAQEFHALAENAPDIIQRLDRDLRHLYANPALERYTGVPRESIVGRTGRATLGAPEAVHRQWEDAVRRVFDTGLEEEFEFTAHAPSGGGPVWLHARLVPEAGLDGEIGSVLAITRDVTESRLARERLRASEEYHRALVEHSTEGVAVLNAGGTVRRTSLAGAEIEGANPAWRTGRSAFESVHPDDRPRMRALHAELLREEGGVRRTETRVPMPGGEERTLEVVARNLLHHPAVRGIVVNFRDVTEQIRAAEAVRASEARFRTVVESLGEGLVITGPGGEIVYANRRMAAMCGYEPEEMQGRDTLELLIPPETRPAARARLRARLSGESQTFDTCLLRRDGSRIWVQVTGVPHRDGGGVIIGTVAVVKDVTEQRRAAAELRASQERLSLILGQVPALIWTTDAELRVTSSAGNGLEQAGLRPGEGEGRLLEETFAGGPEHAPLAEHRRALAGEVVRYEIEWNGRVFATVLEPFRDASGEIVGTLGMALDVTEQRAAERALRESERLLRATVGSAPMLLWTLDAEGRFTSSEGAALRDLGSAPNQRVGESIFEAYAAYPGVLDDTRRALRGETVESIRALGRRVYTAHYTPVTGEDGRVSGVIGVALDVTDRHRAQEALHESERRFRSLIENASDVISVVREDGTVEFASPSVERLLGIPRDSLVGRSILELVHPDDLPHAAERLQRAVENAGTPEKSEFRARHADGEWRMVEVIGTSLLQDDAVGGVVLNIRDVTDRQRAAQALEESQAKLIQAQKMEAVGRLAGGVAHDFNNLLTAIRGNAELLVEDLEPGSPSLDDVHEICLAADRAAALTRQLLAFSRKQVLQPRVMDLNDTVAGVEKMLRRLIGEDVALSTELRPGLGRVRADPGQLEQVLLNLAVNARDAMPGGGRLVVRTANAALGEEDVLRYDYVVPGEYVLLSVGDTGAGMDEETAARAFEPFFTTKPAGQGTGLGLSTVYGIVKQSGGYVWIDSRPEAGTTVRIYLPRVDLPAAAPAGEPPPRAAAAPCAGRETLLLVDDDEAVRKFASRALRRAGYRVLEACDGEEALRVSGQHAGRVDLAITDVVMPRMGGRDLVRRLRHERPETRVLFISGYSEAAVAADGMVEPDSGFVGKPFTPESLLDRVREVLDGAVPAGHAAGGEAA